MKNDETNWIYLFFIEASEAKHTNLAFDVRPVVLGTFFCQIVNQLCSHCNNTIGHAFDFF